MSVEIGSLRPFEAELLLEIEDRVVGKALMKLDRLARWIKQGREFMSAPEVHEHTLYYAVDTNLWICGVCDWWWTTDEAVWLRTHPARSDLLSMQLYVNRMYATGLLVTDTAILKGITEV